MEPRKLTKEDIDKVRHIEGFPIAKDEDIIALSNAPYYTACPNPFIEDFLNKYGTPYDEETDDYHREPFAFDVSEGKYNPLYKLHSYPTKVPHKAIMHYIMHYTVPGDVVLDGFCGSGMTGLAAQTCGINQQHNLLSRDRDPNIGTRKTILLDLSPTATHIAHNYNSFIDTSKFFEQAENIFADVTKEMSWMNKTAHIPGKTDAYGEINYIVW